MEEVQVIPMAAHKAAVDALKTPSAPFNQAGVLTWEEVATIALEAAAPHIKADAWEEGVRAVKEYAWNDDVEPLTNPYRSTK